MFKFAMLALLGVVLSVQLTGCFFQDRDHRDHHDDHHDHDAGVDVHLHG